MSSSKNRIVSSAYCRIHSLPSTKCGTTPFIWLSSLALETSNASISATKLNTIGDRGSPCLSPFFVWKKLPTLSLTWIPTLPHGHYFLYPITPLRSKTLHSKFVVEIPSSPYHRPSQNLSHLKISILDFEYPSKYNCPSSEYFKKFPYFSGNYSHSPRAKSI